MKEKRLRVLAAVVHPCVYARRLIFSSLGPLDRASLIKLRGSMTTHFHRATPFVVLLIAVMPFTSSFAQKPDWERPGTQEEAAVARANVELDKVYQQLTRKLDATGQKSLKEAERAWIKWRDAEADLIARVGGAVGGSAFRVDYSNALRALIEQRTELLRGYIKDADANQ